MLYMYKNIYAQPTARPTIQKGPWTEEVYICVYTHTHTYIHTHTHTHTHTGGQGDPKRTENPRQQVGRNRQARARTHGQRH